MFIAFTGEETGHLGGKYYVAHPLFPLARTPAMLNLDMVGRLRDDTLIVKGAATAADFARLLDGNEPALRLQPDGDARRL